MAKKHSNSERFSFLDNLIEGCQILDQEWRYVYLNASAIVHALKPLDELIGVRIMDAYPGFEQAEVFTVMQRVMQSRRSEEMDNQFTYPDGRQGWFHLRIQPCDEGILILSDDITDRRLSRNKLETQLNRLETLRQIDLAIVSSADISVLSEVVLDHLTTALEVDAALIQLLDPDTLVLDRLHVRGLRTPPDVDQRLRAGEGIQGRVALERKTIYVEDLAAEPDFLRESFVARESFVSYHGTPLASAGRVIGVLEVFDRKQQLRDAEWQQFFEILAGQVAIAISHVQNINKMHRANVQLSLAYDRTIEGWAKTLEMRDIETVGHSKRVTELADDLATHLNYSGPELLDLRRGAMLHDIGKIGIPDEILFKPDKLSDPEWEVMQRHPSIAFDLLSKVDFLKPALVIPRYHHERWDGTGYPAGLRGDIIPEPARIFAIVDVWDALLSDRPYRKRWTKKKTAAYIKEQSGSHFDPQICDVFLSEVV